jgi:hypothetical protein
MPRVEINTTIAHQLRELLRIRHLLRRQHLGNLRQAVPFRNRDGMQHHPTGQQLRQNVLRRHTGIQLILTGADLAIDGPRLAKQ